MPGTVKVVRVMLWIQAVVSAVFFLLTLAGLVFFADDPERPGTATELVLAVLLTGAFGAAVGVFAWWTRTRRQWVQVGVVLVEGASLLIAIVDSAGIASAAWALVMIVLVLQGDARRWFNR